MSDTFASLYLQDPATAIRMRQLQAAQRLRQEGASSAPVQHWTQGLNRILQSVVGGLDERSAMDAMRQEQEQQRSEADTFMRGLMGGGNVQQLVAAAQQPQAVSPAPGEQQQPAPTAPPSTNFTVPGGDIYGGRGGPALAARDGDMAASAQRYASVPGRPPLGTVYGGQPENAGPTRANPETGAMEPNPWHELRGQLPPANGQIAPLGGQATPQVAPITPAAPSQAQAPALASGTSMMSTALAAMSSNNPLIRQRAPVLMQLAQRQMDDERRAQERRDDRGYRVEDRDFAARQAQEQARLAASLAAANRPPMLVAPGAVLVDPRTHQPVYTAPRETFGGSGVEADAIRLLMDPNADAGSPAYGIAYQRLYGPRQVQQPDGTIVIMTPQPPPGIRMPAGMQAPGAPPPQATAPQQQPPVAQVDPGSPVVQGPAPGLVASPPQMPGQQPTTTQTPAGAVTRIPGRGTPLSDGAINSLSEQGGILSQWRALGETFNPDFGGYGSGLVGRAANTIARNTPGASPRADWWQQFDSLDNVVRNQLFGSALTATEQRAWAATTVDPGTNPETIRANLARRQQIVRDAVTRQARARLANGANPQAVSEATGIPLEVLMAPQAAPGTGGAAPSTSGWGIRPVER